MTMMHNVNGIIDGIAYSIDESIVKRLKESHNVDAIKEIEEALKKFKDTEKAKNAQDS